MAKLISSIGCLWKSWRPGDIAEQRFRVETALAPKVRSGSKAEVQRLAHLRLLLGGALN